MLLSGSSLYRRNNLPCYAQLGKRTERCLLIGTEITDSLIKTDHAFLNNIFTLGTY